MVSSSALFRPIKLGASELQHRVVLPALTRFRAGDNHVPSELNKEYYVQRATPGGLLITEATFISPTSGLYPHAPGIYTQDQIDAWKSITDAVHAKQGVIYSQLWHTGRATDSSFMNGHTPDSASEIAISGTNLFTGKEWEVPHALTIEEIKGIVDDYAQAAKNAIEAGFDGIEIHGANGYLLDQFINTSSNKRTDKYGGSIENRTRFTLEVVDAIINAIGAERVGLRLSPWSGFQDMADETPYDTWGYLVSQLQAKHSDMAYIHMVEPRDDAARENENDTTDSLDPFRKLWKGTFISAGGYTTNPALAQEVADETGNLIAIGRAFIANPDIVERLRNGYPLTKYNRDTFYTPGAAAGYTDYPFYSA